MRKLLSITCALACLAIAPSAGFSLGMFGDATEADSGTLLAPEGARGAHAVLLPVTPPGADASHPEAYGYRSSEALARRLSAQAAADSDAPADPAPAGGASTSVTVTAVVLPVRTIVVREGVVTEIWSNTPDLSAGDSMYVVREGSSDGEPRKLDAATWAQARELLARANRATLRVA